RETSRSAVVFAKPGAQASMSLGAKAMSEALAETLQFGSPHQASIYCAGTRVPLGRARCLISGGKT
ncbi:MAG: hypothetical protein DME26_15385, partial [Verrucomicrobia bacterium]